MTRLEIGEQMILAEWLFVETVDDLRRRSEGPAPRTRYELLGIAPLLRKLLLDEAPLLHTVRAVRRDVPVKFRILPWTEPENGPSHAGFTRYLGIGDEQLVGGPDALPTSLKRFLGTVVGMAEGIDLTVKGVIRYYAHVEGGVHFGRTRDPGEPTLSTMSPMLLGHSTGHIQVLAHLGRTVADALQPMRRSILSEPTIHSIWHVKDELGFYANHWTTEYFEARRHP